MGGVDLSRYALVESDKIPVPARVGGVDLSINRSARIYLLSITLPP